MENANMGKTVILHVPFDDECTVILKPIGDGDEKIWMEVVNEPAEVAGTDNEKLFFCFQNKVRTRFRPQDYAYIESTSNHYSLWHPIDRSKPVLSIYMRSLHDILSKLHDVGLTQFVRVHDSYIVNMNCIISYRNDNIVLTGGHLSIPIGHGHRHEFYGNVVTV
ncbi:MAG: LytTR family transcriptional regulator [Prevotella sp.]|nr:LytTR family transcriptional regulator [Prevotella sp.]